MFDRSMTIAAQVFTSVFPIIILTSTLTDDSGDATAIGEALGMSEPSQSVIEQAVANADSAAFGLAGTVIVLASATSLSRALTRAFTAIWAVPRVRSTLASAWRWLAAVLALTLALVLVHSLSGLASVLPPRAVWPLAVSMACDLAVAIFIPWVLLAGAVAPRLLIPSALIFAVLMLGFRPASAVWLPRAIEVSAERYGSIGIAFAYLGWLYCASFLFLTTAVVGSVIANDGGRLGSWIRRGATGAALRRPTSGRLSGRRNDEHRSRREV